jgi:hypothetical protein
MDINLKRARLWNGWLLISGQRRLTDSATESPHTIEIVVRCESVNQWTYDPAGKLVMIEPAAGALLIVRESRVGPVSGTGTGMPVEQLDDLLWQGCVGTSGSPLRGGDSHG